MTNIRTTTTSITIFVTALGLLTGCPTTTTPEDGQIAEQDPPGDEVPDEQAKAMFADAYAKYVAAKQDGELSADECSAVTEQFNAVYEHNKRSMLVARYNVGAVWEECGELDEATKIYEELGAKNFHLALNNLGALAWSRGDSKTALELFARSVDADKTQAFAARNNLAAAHRNRYAAKAEQADFEIAEKQIQNVLAVDTSNKAAYENLARLYYDRGRLEDPSYLILANLVVTQALRVLDKQGKQSADIWNLEGLLLMQEDNQVDALRAFKKAVEIEPRHPDANRNIGFIAIRFRDYATAEKSFATALESDSVVHDVEVYLGMGVAKRGLNKFAEAQQWYEKATKVDDHDPRPWYNLAILNQDHLTGQPDVDEQQILAYYAVAKRHCATFETMARTDKSYAAAIEDCADRIAIIDDTIDTIEKMREMEETLARLEAEAAKQEAARRQRLRELEEQAIAAGEPSPEELADAEAAAEDAKQEAEHQAQQDEQN